MLSIGLPILKWLFNRRAKRKLSDQEFVDAITSFQAKRGRVGQAAIDADTALAKAQAEMKAEREADKKE